jgi:uncharacterized membrane protein YozB (DUF420 family)
MEYVQIIATVSLSVQISVLFLLLGGYTFKRMKKFRQHGITMLTAVVLHSAVIWTWMIWSLFSFFGSGSINFADVTAVVTLVHAFTGIVVELLGIWLVCSWRLRADMQTCFKKKRIMLVTLTLWLITLSLGIILYLVIMKIF